ncbi:MAG: hypothetical protein ACREQY_04620 [Candidatus Binatia bacterium]
MSGDDAFDLAGEVVIDTGGGMGIGKAAGLSLARNGTRQSSASRDLR